MIVRLHAACGAVRARGWDPEPGQRKVFFICGDRGRRASASGLAIAA